jgi:2,5-diketo-D-gluconate reductase A
MTFDSHGSPVPTITLNDGNVIPSLGFGVFKVPEKETQRVVSTALSAGYRSIDTARMYGNEGGVGAAIAESGIPRNQLFVTTKLWNDDQGYDKALKAFDGSLKRLGLEYLDLFLIHWPVPSQDLYVETFKAFQKIRDEGRVKSIGVSNFTPEYLTRLINETGETPAVNQVELHPAHPQGPLRVFDKAHGIATEAWSPLGRGAVLNDPIIRTIADQHGKTTAQTVIRWHLQLGNIAIPKSVTADRIVENFDVFDFELSEDDMISIDGVQGSPIGPDPTTFTG